MNSSTRRTLAIVALLCASPAGAQQLGNKVLGTLGLLAGSQPPNGLYIVNRFLIYSATDLIGRDGRAIPVDLRLDAVANAVGFEVTYKLPWRSTYWNATFGAPWARIHLDLDRPEASIDRFGLGDLYVQPVKLGWKTSQVDVVTGYGFYAPSGRFDTRTGNSVGAGHWTHQFSLGSALYFDRAKTWHISGLASYELNCRKKDIDMTRGDTAQLQGGVGRTVGKVDAGMAFYALRQVRPDRGADLPDALRGARDRAFGLGPEINITVVQIRSRLTFRYCHDVAVRARPLGQVMVIGLTILARR